MCDRLVFFGRLLVAFALFFVAASEHVSPTRRNKTQRSSNYSVDLTVHNYYACPPLTSPLNNHQHCGVGPLTLALCSSSIGGHDDDIVFVVFNRNRSLE